MRIRGSEKPWMCLKPQRGDNVYRPGRLVQSLKALQSGCVNAGGTSLLHRFELFRSWSFESASLSGPFSRRADIVAELQWTLSGAMRQLSRAITIKVF